MKKQIFKLDAIGSNETICTFTTYNQETGKKKCSAGHVAIDTVGKLLFREEKSILVTGTVPFPPLRSFR